MGVSGWIVASDAVAVVAAYIAPLGSAATCSSSWLDLAFPTCSHGSSCVWRGSRFGPQLRLQLPVLLLHGLLMADTVATVVERSPTCRGIGSKASVSSKCTPGNWAVSRTRLV